MTLGKNRLRIGWVTCTLWAVTSVAMGQQPKIGTSPEEPGWSDLLKQQWGLDVNRDLRNPLLEGVSPAALFQRVDKSKPVTLEPIIALGVETTTRCGWYAAGPKANQFDKNAERTEAWSFASVQPDAQKESGQYTPPKLQSGQTTIDPGDQPFGLWVRNDKFNDGGVFTQPSMVATINSRFRTQPYKAMIYPNRDPQKGRLIPNSYIIGWEYSLNDDFQDVVTRIDNVKLLPADPPLRGVLSAETSVKKLAGGFKFVEGPAWDSNHKVLYFSDIPAAQIIQYADGKATVANSASGGANGLMLDAQGKLVACEGAGRRISRAVPGQPGTDVAAQYKGKKLNSPNDLWIDKAGGIYFTDPAYGKSRENMEQDKEAVYYAAADGKIFRIIGDLVRPNGIALSPDGTTLYVVDNGTDTLHRYALLEPGRIGKGERIAYVAQPDGMTVDAKGRLYVAGEGGIAVLNANGKWLGLIETPERPANCTFGGLEGEILFITARTSLYGIKTRTRGWHIHLDGLPGKSTSRPSSKE